ncbi:imidazole glycerol phosphate synthase subunit HisH [Corynebacterium kroppenstedtii]|uniref:imidazole glycerol phosphate synthase subunit HisH n=1 Tax=Corynebacterium sp. PCR 32 TaxID=3351342 RepID=UPI00375282C2
MMGSKARPTVAILDYGSGNVRSVERALERVGADVTVTADPELVLSADGLLVPGVGAFAACMQGLREVHGPRLIGQRLAGGRPVLGVCVGMQVLFEYGVEFGDGVHGDSGGSGGEVSPRPRRCREVVPPGATGSGEEHGAAHDHGIMCDPETGRPLDPTIFSTEVSDEGVVSIVGCGEWPGTVARLDANIVPHMGWNTLEIPEGSHMFNGVASDDRVYFVHSYAVQQWEMVDDGLVAPPKVTWSQHDDCRFVAAVENGPLWATQFHPEKSGAVGGVILQNWVSTL